MLLLAEAEFQNKNSVVIISGDGIKSAPLIVEILKRKLSIKNVQHLNLLNLISLKLRRLTVNGDLVDFGVTMVNRD